MRDDELIILMVVVFVIALIPAIFFLINLQETLKRIKPQNRTIEPDQVWLNLIPLFSIVWQLITVNRIADSLKAELADRGISSTEDRPGAQIGVAYCTLNVCSVIPGIGGLLSLGGLI